MTSKGKLRIKRLEVSLNIAFCLLFVLWKECKPSLEALSMIAAASHTKFNKHKLSFSTKNSNSEAQNVQGVSKPRESGLSQFRTILTALIVW